MVVPSAQVNTFNGGQMTDLPEFAGTFDGTELFEVVAPGNEAEGINYSITSALLAFLIGSVQYALTIITSGASYDSVDTDTRILVNKTIGSATTINLLAGDLYSQSVLIKDMKGDADVNPITITFPGTYDGVSSPIVINASYGSIWFNPLPEGNFYAD